MLLRRDLFTVLQQKFGESRKVQTEHLFNYLARYFDIEEDVNAQRHLRKECSRFCSKLYAKFDACAKMVDRFLNKNGNWLDGTFAFKKEDEGKSSEEVSLQPSTSKGSTGRPRQGFADIGERAKRKRAVKLTEIYEAEELAFAAKKGLKEKGQKSASELISEAVFTTPTRATKMRSSWLKTRQGKQIVPFNEDEALSLIIEAKLSKHQYLLLRREAKKRNVDMYPSYHKILEAKSRCYPSKEAIAVTETSAEVQLQHLLNHTTSRLLQLQRPVLVKLTTERLKHLIMVVKWGCDGSTGHSQFKQRYAEAGLGDGDLFLTSLVPLQLYSQLPGEEKIIVWQNPRPSSTRFCRPIRFQFQKETRELAVLEQQYIESQIARLVPTSDKLEEQDIIVRHVCVLTMINGKVCNALTGTPSAQTCYVCKATPVQMNDIDKILEKQVNEEVFQFGLSTLHAWIRFFECLLHVSYRLDIKKWHVRGEDKPIVEARKKKIQEDFKNKMGLLVDFPKTSGSGTSNDGNTARRFFQNPAQSAVITGIQEELIKRFGVVLAAISCGYEVNYAVFDEYAVQTARLFVSTYPWYYMPASVHKILVHGSAIIRSALLPIGQLSEEAQESRNKDLKTFRESHTRKISRVSGNEDLLNRLLISSDPLMSSCRQLPKRKLSTFSADVIGLLKEPEMKLDDPSFTCVMETSDTETDISSSSDDETESDHDTGNQ